MRREYTMMQAFGMKKWGLPLHAQGIPVAKSLYILFHGDYPCMRREYETDCQFLLKIGGLPLHAQGIPRSDTLRMRLHWITPACAGNT